MVTWRTTVKTVDGQSDNHPTKTVDRSILLAFLDAAGVDANRALTLNITPDAIQVEYVYGGREVFQIVDQA